MITLHNGYQINDSSTTIYSTKIIFHTITSNIEELRTQLSSTDNLSEIDIDGITYYDYIKVNTFETQIGSNPMDLTESIKFTVKIELRSQTVNDAVADIREQVSSLTKSLNESLQTINFLQKTVNEQSIIIEELRNSTIKDVANEDNTVAEEDLTEEPVE